MDAAGVDGAILVPPSWEGDRNDLALAAAAAHPARFAVMGRLRLDDHTWEDVIEGWRTVPGMAGFRLTFHTPTLAQRLADPDDALWHRLAANDARVMLSLPGIGGKAGPVARRHPGLRMAIDHCALPPRLRGAEAFGTLSDLIGLASLPNVTVKLSALPCYASDGAPFASLAEPVRRLVDAFGPHRLFWGSDLTRLPCPYRDCVNLFAEHLPFTASEQALIVGEALSAWIDWPRVTGR